MKPMHLTTCMKFAHANYVVTTQEYHGDYITTVDLEVPGVYATLVYSESTPFPQQAAAHHADAVQRVAGVNVALNKEAA